ncbi:MAG: hypothetical protein K8R59_15900 [Thermoanaerobaculales bacterium]|nr:hypothetical protein [Thermoanaerobaculales bacterium]
MRLYGGLALVLVLFAAVDCVQAQDVCPPDVVWSEVGCRSVFVHHDLAEFNCCPTMDYQISQGGFTIDIFEIEVEPGCYCVCCFDLTHELTGLAPGIYTARVWGAYGCEDTPCGSTVFTVPEPPAAAQSAKTTPFMVSSMSDCGGWPLFADDFESGSTSAWDEPEH